MNSFEYVFLDIDFFLKMYEEINYIGIQVRGVFEGACENTEKCA
jgi:hypothetical protein